MIKTTLLQQFEDLQEQESIPSKSDVLGVLVSDEELGNLVAMFEHPGYSVYSRIIEMAMDAAVGGTMDSTEDTPKSQYDVGKGIRRMGFDLARLPKISREALESIQRNAKLRKTA